MNDPRRDDAGESERLFLSMAHQFETGIMEFTPCLVALHAEFDAKKFRDWPTVLLSTLLQTTALSIYSLIPRSNYTDSPIDRRSIASLIRNLVDTHDAIDALCGHAMDSEKWNLARDIMGHYLSHQIHTIQTGIDPINAQSFFQKSKGQYWERIERGISDKARKRGIRDGRSIFYETRRERVERTCGSDATFVLAILDDLSTYVHSLPPAIWLKTLKEAFSDTPTNRASLAVWLRIATFYFASSVRVTLGVFRSYDAPSSLRTFLDLHETVFANS